MTAYIEWIFAAFGVLFFGGAILILLVVVFVKLRGRGRSATTAPAANPFAGASLRKRMEAEEQAEADRITDALYTTARHLKAQEERHAAMKSGLAGLSAMFGGTPPNA